MLNYTNIKLADWSYTMAYNIVKHRRGTTQAWLAADIVPENGEIVIEECSDGIRKCKIGNGINYFTDLPYVDEFTEKELLEKINSLRLDFGKQLNSLLNRVYELNAVQTDTATKLATDVSDLFKLHTDEYNSILKELALLDEAHKAANLAISDSVLAYITKIYVELADLIDDDIAIVQRVFELKSRVEDIDVRLEEALLDIDSIIKSGITDILDNVDKTFIKPLNENIENLRSSTNVKFSDNQKAHDNLEKLIHTSEVNTTNKITALETTITQNKVELNDTISAINHQIETANNKITDIDKNLNIQTLRISQLTKPVEGSEKEVEDIRIGYNSIEYECAGDAVRAIGNDLDALKASLPDYIPANAVDGLLYEDSLLYLTSSGVPVSEPVKITGGSGGGGSTSTVRVKNNLASNTFTVAKGKEAVLDFTFTSFENEVPTGDGTFSITINNKKIDVLSGNILHGVAKKINVAEHLKNGNNDITVTCIDMYGTARSLYYSISVIELRIESSFDCTRIFDDKITFRYKVFGQIEKTAYVLVDGVEISNKQLSSSVHGNEITLNLPKQPHGCHTITAYISTMINETPVQSNILEYEIICIEEDNNTALLASTCNITEVTQGDLVTIPYMLYDPIQLESTVDLIIYSRVSGELIEIDKTSLVVDRSQQFWKTRKYPTGTVVFVIIYTYNLYGVQKTVSKSHTLSVKALDIDIYAEEDSLQLHLSAQGRSNNEANPAIWSFTQASNDDTIFDTVTTNFSNFNWKSNGWTVDDAGDTCLRLNGDARAVINFKPFKDDFKLTGKTIEFEFAVRDVNSRDTTVIDCFDGSRGFKATPDTAFLQSSGTKVSCRYKDEERIRVAVAIEYADSLSRFVSIYLDGILSGVQRYAVTDNFAQDKPLNITLGSNLCGLDVYSIRIYDKALSTQQILNNYIADKTEPTTKLQLATDNELYDENGKISYDRVKALGQIPIITFTGAMPTYKGDKKKKSVQMKFEDPLNPEMNFDVLLDQIDVQGTSSQFYVRKNWKVKLPEARPHMPGAIPAKVYCIKVDYAEATGTHNTGTANYVETFYDRNEVTLPPQKDDTRVRTTIQGFPVILFEKATEDSEPVFSSKGNFNYDKDAENAFGFTEDYKNYGVECWEFCNNTSDPVNFVGEVPKNWLEDFEPRYVPESANFERIEELQEIAELAASGKATMTEAQRQELSMLMDECIANFKEMHDWVLSTVTYKLVDGKRIPITPTPLANAITYGETTYTEDSEEYRLAKFKYEFENYFNLHYTSIYYVFTLFALMTDQRANNLFLTRWKDADGVHRWYPYFYDNDTIFGINNEGAMVFDYYHEDTDQLGSSNVYNGQNSAFWNNFRICFPQKIQETYSELRSNKKLTYDALIDAYITKGSDKWSASVYNEDAEYKYITMARQLTEDGDVDASNLYQVRGPGEHHLRYFVDNRLNYCDSKWYAGEYPDDYIFLRIYTPTTTAITDDMTDAQKAEAEASNARILASLAAVPANPSITVTPFSDMYAGVRYKSGTLQQQRTTAGIPYTFSPLDPNETFGDTETAIYGASELSSLGDMSGLYCGVISLGKASKLVELKMGNENPAYHNDNFREISVGSNRLLRKIDLRNCSGLGIAGKSPQKTLELSGCPNIEYIYTEGTNLESVDLPDSGYIKTLHLPASINTLVIKNQKYITDFSIESYSNIRTLCLENCPTLNTDEILAACRQSDGKYTVERVRLTGIDWHFENTDFVKSLFPVFDEQGNIISGIRGIDEKNNNLDDAYLVGTCYIEKLTGAEYTEIKSHYPYLDIKFGEMTSNVIFVYSDIDENEHTYTFSFTSTNSELGTCPEPVLVPAPAWQENDAFTYELAGWSRRHQVSKGLADSEEDYLEYIQADALLNIAGDRTLYPVFKAVRKKYEVTFINASSKNSIILQTVMTPYAKDAVYSEATPVKQDVAKPEIYEFTGWHPSPEKITGPTVCYAQFAVIDSKWYTLSTNDITHKTNTADNTMSITKCLNTLNTAVKVPYELNVDTNSFYVTSISGFRDYTNLELISLPETLLEISSGCFSGCYNLFEVNLPESLKTIGKEAFKACKKLKEIFIPTTVSSIASEAFRECSGLDLIKVADDNKYYKVDQDCLIEISTNKLLRGLNTGIIPSYITQLDSYCFAYTAVNSAIIPEGITSLPTNAFSGCASLADLVLPSTLKTINATCFAWCSSLKNISLPDGLETLYTYVFDACAFEELIIPASVNSIMSHAFGEIKNLKTVTFKKRVDSNGNIIIPNISCTSDINRDYPNVIVQNKAFNRSGSSNHELVFNVPWSEEQHMAKFSGFDENGNEKFPDFGAINCRFNFDYEDGN